MTVDELRTDREALLRELEALGSRIRGAEASCPAPTHEDRNPSASIYEDAAGVWRVCCHRCGLLWDTVDLRAMARGCEPGDVLRELRAQEQPDRPRQTSPAPARTRTADRTWPSLDSLRAHLAARHTIERVHHYCDPDTRRPSLVVFRLRTGDGKTFRQATPAPGGGWALRGPRGPCPLYNRTRVRDAATVVVVEGERCVEELHRVGIVATTSPGGSSNAAKADWSPLRGKHVVLWPDHDDAGTKYANDVQRILEPIAAEIRRIDPIRLEIPPEPGDDAVDFLEALRSADDETRRRAVANALADAVLVGASTGLWSELRDAAAGRRMTLTWPFDAVGRLTKALQPGSVTILCGDPGTNKSTALLQCVQYWTEQGYSSALLELESGRDFHLRRALAQRAGISAVTDDAWLRDNPEEVGRLQLAHGEWMERIGRLIHEPAGDEPTTYADLAEWIEQQASRGVQIVIADPMTSCVGGRNLWQDQHKFIVAAKRSADTHGARVILAAHPRKRAPNERAVSLDMIAGSAAAGRHVDTVLWLSRLDVPEEAVVRTPAGDRPAAIDRRMLLLKTRFGRGQGAAIGFRFAEDSLRLVEQGIIAPKGKQG